MANPEHVEIVKQGAKAIKKWYEQNPSEPLDLSKADLREADLTEANLYCADLYCANLSEADLTRAVLSYARLHDADLSGANLHYADLSGANLHGAKLSGAGLKYADLSGADLSHADLRGVKLASTTSFKELENVSRAKVDRRTVEYMFSDPTSPQRMDLYIIDDLATLRGAFGGLSGFIWWAGLAAFLLPPIWFITSTLVTSKFQEARTVIDQKLATVGNSQPKEQADTITIPLMDATCRYIWNGGKDWQTGYKFHFTSVFFVFNCAYRFLSLYLLFKAIQLLNEQRLHGIPADFSFRHSVAVEFPVIEDLKGQSLRDIWKCLWQGEFDSGKFYLGTYGQWYKWNTMVSWVVGIAAVWNAYHFWMLDVTVPTGWQ